MRRLLAILITLMIAISVSAEFVLAETESSSDAPAVAKNLESSDDEIDYSRYQLVTEKQAIKLIAKAIKKHKKTLRFRIDGYSSPAQEGFKYAKELLYKAYGNIPDFYEVGIYFQYKTVYGSIPEKGCFEYEFDYSLSKKQCDAFEKKLKKVEKSLKLKGKSDKQKAVIIYKWITKNVKYDKKYSAYSETPYNALIKKKAVCQGVASLYYRMLKDAGVDCCCIKGLCRNNEPHVWVLVKIGKKWYNADPTWDLGKKQYNYLFRTNKSFSGHTRLDSYRTKKFVKAHPMGKKNLKY